MAVPLPYSMACCGWIVCQFNGTRCEYLEMNVVLIFHLLEKPDEIKRYADMPKIIADTCTTWEAWGKGKSLMDEN
jgi:hypothetical protein